MNIRKNNRSIGGFCVVCCVLIASSFGVFVQENLFAQEKMNDNSVSAVPTTVPFLRHHAGVGLSWAGGTPTLGGDGIMFSGLYAYSLTPMLDMETSLNYLGRAEVSLLSSGQNWGFLSSSWTGDVTFMARLFDASDRFRIGIGPSVQWHGFTRGSTLSTDQNGVTTREPIQFYETTSLGANLKVEYLIPLSQKLDLGLRGQIHAFSRPFSGPTYITGASYTGSVGIGIFIRGNW
jgi:hypothetical protein